MSRSLSEQAQAALARRRAEYAASLPERADTLERCLEDQNSDSARQLAHRLSGSAGLYDLQDVQRAASLLEERLRAGNPICDLGVEVQALVDCLRAAR